jgi:WhiB family transcriptional regulator, redox-sensing transcriptional regulator
MTTTDPDLAPLPDDPPDWRDQAACRGLNPDLFFPERGANAGLPKRVCAACPVRPDCLAESLAANEQFGVWGGLSKLERRAIRAARNAAGVGAPRQLPRTQPR